MNRFPCLIRSSSPSGETRYALGDPLVDGYLAFVAGRCRPNTVRATAHNGTWGRGRQASTPPPLIALLTTSATSATPRATTASRSAAT